MYEDKILSDLEKRSVPGRTYKFTSDIIKNIYGDGLYYINSLTKCVELILINKFGSKNIPQFWWKIKYSTPEIYSYQKKLFPICARILKQYPANIFIIYIINNKLSWIGTKNIGLVQYKLRELELTYDKATNPDIYSINENIVNPDSKSDYRSEEFKTNKNNVLDWIDNE